MSLGKKVKAELTFSLTPVSFQVLSEFAYASCFPSVVVIYRTLSRVHAETSLLLVAQST